METNEVALIGYNKFKRNFNSHHKLMNGFLNKAYVEHNIILIMNNFSFT